ncbi:MAG: ABC transporter permease, partial [Bacteroidales bacterium]|nr:ABC transporter permease [Bacteroidales bacterium]
MFKIKQLFTVPSLLNVAGIAIAVAAFYVLSSIAFFEFTFNHSIPQYQNIYQLSYSRNGGQLNNTMMRPLSEAIGQNYASVEKYGCMNPWGSGQLYAKKDGEYRKLSINYAKCSKSLFDVFGFQIIEGDTSQFINYNQMAISQKTAEQYGLKVGDRLKSDLQNTDEMEIVAIYQTMEANTEFANFGGFRCFGDDDISDPSEWSYVYYMKFMDGAPKPKVSNESKETMRDLVKKFFKDTQDRPKEAIDKEIDGFQLKFISLDELRLHSEISGFHQRTDKHLAYTLVLLSAIVIAIAFINYFNFFMARVPQRLKSVNTRKVLGSSRNSLIASIVGESIIFTLIAVALAMVIVYTIMPLLLDDKVNMGAIVYSNYKALILTILTAIVAAIVTSIYPAIHITSVPPAMALKGQLTQGHDSILRHILIGMQVTASVILIICSIFIHRNNDYLSTRDIGFDNKNLLCTYTTDKIAKNRETVRTKLLANPNIKDIAWTTQDFISIGRMTWGRPNIDNQEEIFYYAVCPVSWNFLDFMGIEVTDGRNFAENDEQCADGVMIFNETARQQLNVSTSSRISGHTNNQCELAGFCNDFNFKPLQYGISPFAFYIFGKESWHGFVLRKLYIRTTDEADVQSTINYIHTTLTSIDPDYEITNPGIVTF